MGAGFITKEYKTIRAVSGPLIMVERVKDAGLGEMCEVRLPHGETRTGQIIEIRADLAVVQVLEGTQGMGLDSASVVFTGEPSRIGLSRDMLGRTFSGIGLPIDGFAPIIAEDYRDINGLPMNPCSREKPDLFIETGISAIDGLNTLVRGQKLPIFTLSGLPSDELALQIIRHSRVSTGEEFSIVFGAMGITSREAFMFSEGLSEAGALSRTVSFVNLAGDPIIEKLFTPRIALTAAEYLAFDLGHHVMVVLTDMASYCDALRVIGGAREEIPGRRGYPGYMYTDLATLYERAGRVKGRGGSITVMPIVTMPDDDITHPIPDLTGYITEGQIVLSRVLDRKSVYPPIDVLPSLSRLMNLGIGRGKTGDRHRELADQLYAAFARGVDVRRVVAIVGEEGLTELDRGYLRFADEFERTFVGQGKERRSIDGTLSFGRELLKLLPERELTRMR